MWPVSVAVDPEVLDQNLCLEQRLEDLAVEELISELAVERLDEGILPGAPWLDVAGARVREPAPVAKGVAVSSGQLSIRKNAGHLPVRATMRSKTRTV